MNEYIEKNKVINFLEHNDKVIHYVQGTANAIVDRTVQALCGVVAEIPAADVQEKRYCKMIPLEPDCRGYTDVFICTNCHNHIHLGFIKKEYRGSYCLECGAEVKDGDSE